jgi:hypothetical protein
MSIIRSKESFIVKMDGVRSSVSDKITESKIIPRTFFAQLVLRILHGHIHYPEM